MDSQHVPADGRDRSSAAPSADLTDSTVAPPDPHTLAAFGLDPDLEPVSLAHGEERVFRVGDVVLKLTEQDRAVAAWIADLHDSIQEDGFRIGRPLRTVQGGWLTADGWSAWTHLDGHHDFRGRIPECVRAIARYHAALSDRPYPPILDTIDNPWRHADRYAFGERPASVHPALADQIDALYAVRRPLVGLADQLIHGDVNAGNVLVTADPPPEGGAPGIIDMAPYWRPAGFALAVYGYWVGPWWGQPGRLVYFKKIDQFDQLLIRAGLRMLLTMSVSGRLEDLERYARATEVVLEHIRH
jgi:uncharacterized protein (TIGR02569 family)